jgi:integrase
MKPDAEALLQERLEETHRLSGGTTPIMVSGALELYIKDGRIRGLRGLRVPILVGSLDVMRMNAPALHQLQAELLKTPFEGATVNRIMGVLGASLKLAARTGYRAGTPLMPRRLPENRRKGFLEPEGFEAIRRELPSWAADVFEFAWRSGWRRNEVLGLQWSEVNLEEKMIVLSAERSKNGEARERPISRDFEPLVRRRVSERQLGCDYVFHCGGRKISENRWWRTFEKARKAAGLPKALSHDCRRSAARNLKRAGVPTKVAMELLGHKTRTMFDSYNVTSHRDRWEGAERGADYFDELQAKAEERRGDVVPFEKKKEEAK